jgi:hypothetical protein
MLAEVLGSPSSPDRSTTFMPPPVEQTICMLPGLMMVEAMAEPKNSANHTNTSLAMSLELRRLCMFVIMTKVERLLQSVFAHCHLLV